MVIAVVPEGANVMTHFFDRALGSVSEVRLASGTEFMFEAQKCHLGESVTDQSLLTIESELSMPRYDIAKNSASRAALSFISL
ncbi:MAG: hypothetical protein ABSG62_21320 [Terracidiphilus sp.]|jgi:hypothetical protein